MRQGEPFYWIGSSASTTAFLVTVTAAWTRRCRRAARPGTLRRNTATGVRTIGSAVGVGALLACDTSTGPSVHTNVPAPPPAVWNEGSGDTYEGEGVYFCPTRKIAYATIPGNIHPYHTTTVGNRSYPLIFSDVIGVSAAGIPKGRYAITSGPWPSDDGEINIISGSVEGWCHYKRIWGAITEWNYTGSLHVTAFNGQYVQSLDECSGGDDRDGDAELRIGTAGDRLVTLGGTRRWSLPLTLGTRGLARWDRALLSCGPPGGSGDDSEPTDPSDSGYWDCFYDHTTIEFYVVPEGAEEGTWVLVWEGWTNVCVWME